MVFCILVLMESFVILPKPSPPGDMLRYVQQFYSCLRCRGFGYLSRTKVSLPVRWGKLGEGARGPKDCILFFRYLVIHGSSLGTL